MSNDKQWFWTKFVGSCLSLMLILSIGVGATNMHYGLSDRVQRNTDDISTHKESDEKAWDKAWVDIDGNREKIHAIEIQNGRIETMLTQILLRLDKAEANDQRIIDMLNNFEVAN